jgi:hypothetical protein
LQTGRIIILAVISATVIFTGALTRQEGNLFFFFMQSDYYMDLYNTLYWSKLANAYTSWQSIYPPVLLGALRIASLSVGEGLNPVETRTETLWIADSLAVITLGCISHNIFWKRITIQPVEKIMLVIVLGTLAPIVFMLDRMNVLVILFILLLYIPRMIDRSEANSTERNMLLSDKMIQGGRMKTLANFDTVTIALYIASFIKQYMILPLAIYMAVYSGRIRKIAAQGIILAVLYLLLNNSLMGGLIYSGGLELWFSNMVNFSSTLTQQKFAEDIYSICPHCILRGLTASSAEAKMWLINTRTIEGLMVKDYGLLVTFAIVCTAAALLLLSKSVILYFRMRRRRDVNSTIRKITGVQIAFIILFMLMTLVSSFGFYAWAIMAPYLINCLYISCKRPVTSNNSIKGIIIGCMAANIISAIPLFENMLSYGSGLCDVLIGIRIAAVVAYSYIIYYGAKYCGLSEVAIAI